MVRYGSTYCYALGYRQMVDLSTLLQIVSDFSNLRTLVSGVICVCSFQNADTDSKASCSEDLC